MVELLLSIAFAPFDVPNSMCVFVPFFICCCCCCVSVSRSIITFLFVNATRVHSCYNNHALFLHCFFEINISIETIDKNILEEKAHTQSQIEIKYGPKKGTSSKRTRQQHLMGINRSVRAERNNTE